MSALGTTKDMSPQRRVVTETRTVESLSATTSTKSKIIRLKSNVDPQFSYTSQQFLDLHMDELAQSTYTQLIRSRSSLVHLSQEMNMENYVSGKYSITQIDFDKKNETAYHSQIEIHKVR